MDALVSSQVRELASLRFGRDRAVVPYDSALNLYPRKQAVVDRLQSLARDWPSCAGIVGRLKVSRWLPKTDYAHARVHVFSTVSGTIILSRAALTDALVDVRMFGLHETNWTVCSSIEDIVTHEFGHILVDAWTACSYKSFRVNKSVAMDVLIRAAERRSGCSSASLSLSLHSRINTAELLAEAFTDAEKHGLSAHPFSRAVRAELADRWSLLS